MSPSWLAAQQSPINEYRLPSGQSNPTGIAVGADGNLWITETGSNKIAKITTSGHITEYRIPTSDSQPDAITAGPDGNIWFTELSGNKIGQITVDGTIHEYPIARHFVSPTGIAAGGDGRLWFAESSSNRVASMSTAGEITEYSTQDQPLGVAAGPDGNVWFTEPISNHIGKVTPAGVVTEYSLVPFGNTQSAFSPQVITKGPGGKLWFSALHTIWSITTGGAAADYVVPSANFQGSGIAAGPDGNIWFTDQNNNTIGRLSTSGIFSSYAVPSAKSGPTNITAGPDGNLWFTESATSKVGRLNLAAVTPANGPLTLNHDSFSFITYAGGPAPPTQTLSVTSAVPVEFTASASVPIVMGQPWLRISPSGSLTTNQTITITTDPTNMGTHGDYVGNISLKSGGITQIVPVTLTITAPPTTGDITVSPSSLSFSYTTQSDLPILQGISIHDATQGVSFTPVTISYNVISPMGGNWLTLATGGGSEMLPTGSAGNGGSDIRVLVDPRELAPGAYHATVSITPAGGVASVVPVSLTVTASATTVSTSPASLDYDWFLSGPSPPPQPIQIIETGPTAGWNVTGDGTLYVNPLVGTGPATINVYADPLNNSAGTFIRRLGIDLTTNPDVFTFLNVTLHSRPRNPSGIAAVVNAASYATNVVVPGELVTISGLNLGPATPAGAILGSDGKISTSVAGVSVSIGGFASPLLYVSSTQINCVIPYEVAAEVTPNNYFIVPAKVSYSGQTHTFYVTLGFSAPGVFTSDGSGKGQAATLNASGTYNGTNNPAAAGSVVVIYLTGEGQTIPGGITGAMTVANTSKPGPLTPQPQLPLRVTIGGVQAPVTFFGEAPGIVSGVMQINAQVPAGLASGDQPLVVSIGGVSSQPGVTVAVK